MLGIADRNLIFDLFETVLKGDAADALGRMEALYQGGADPLSVIQDLLDLAHFLTRLKLAPEAGSGDPMEEGYRDRARPLAAALPMPVLARAWQMLLKGIEEVQTAPGARQAAEMVLVRLAYVADLPVPAELVKNIDLGTLPTAPPAIGSAPAAPKPAAPVAIDKPAPIVEPESAEPESIEPVFVEPIASATPQKAAPPRADSGNASPAMVAPEPAPLPPPAAPPGRRRRSTRCRRISPRPASHCSEAHREAITYAQLRSLVHLVAFEPGQIEFRPGEGAPRDLASRLGQKLSEWTGTRWVVAVSQEAGAPTLEQQASARAPAVVESEVAQHPLVRAVLDAFPGATIAAVRERFSNAESAGGDEAGSGEDGSVSGEEDEP